MGATAFHRGTKRGVSNAEEEQTRQNEVHYRAAGITGKASQECIRQDSFNKAPSASLSTWSSLPRSPASAMSSVPPAPSPLRWPGPRVGQAEQLQAREDADSQEANVDVYLSPMPQPLSASDGAAEGRRILPGRSGGCGHSGEDSQRDHINGVAAACANPQLGRGLAEHGALTCNGHATVKEGIQEDTVLCLRDGNTGSARWTSKLSHQAQQKRVREGVQVHRSGE